MDVRLCTRINRKVRGSIQPAALPLFSHAIASRSAGSAVTQWTSSSHEPSPMQTPGGTPKQDTHQSVVPSTHVHEFCAQISERLVSYRKATLGIQTHYYLQPPCFRNSICKVVVTNLNLMRKLISHMQLYTGQCKLKRVFGANF